MNLCKILSINLIILPVIFGLNDTTKNKTVTTDLGQKAEYDKQGRPYIGKSRFKIIKLYYNGKYAEYSRNNLIINKFLRHTRRAEPRLLLSFLKEDTTA